MVIEGLSLSSAGAFGDDQDDDSSGTTSDHDDDDDNDDNGEGSSKLQGITYYVGGGKMKKMDGGMSQYVKIIERKVTKRAKKVGG